MRNFKEFLKIFSLALLLMVTIITCAGVWNQPSGAFIDVCAALCLGGNAFIMLKKFIDIEKAAKEELAEEQRKNK